MIRWQEKATVVFKCLGSRFNQAETLFTGHLGKQFNLCSECASRCLASLERMAAWPQWMEPTSPKTELFIHHWVPALLLGVLSWRLVSSAILCHTGTIIVTVIIITTVIIIISSFYSLRGEKTKLAFSMTFSLLYPFSFPFHF